MLGVNKVFLLGTTTADAEYKNISAEMSLAKVSLATNRFKKSPDGSKQQEAEFHRLTFWGKQAEFAGKIVKGTKLFVEGRIKTDTWEDQQGNKKYSTGIIVENFQIIYDKPVDNSSGTAEMVRDVFGA